MCPAIKHFCKEPGQFGVLLQQELLSELLSHISVQVANLNIDLPGVLKGRIAWQSCTFDDFPEGTCCVP